MLAVGLIGMVGSADAAPLRKKAPARRAAAKVVPARPALPAAVQPPGIMVPKPVTLVKPTPAEQQAHAVWTLRAALNVAALQCQYSPFLRTVDNYNNMLGKHAAELTAAQNVMVNHFKRTQKAGLAAFDRYNTRSYNSFSTLDAQYSFCWTAGQAGQALRVANVGTMARVAEIALPAVRAALAHQPSPVGLAVPPLAQLPQFGPQDPVQANN